MAASTDNVGVAKYQVIRTDSADVLVETTFTSHFAAINAYMLFQIGYNVYAHLGYEILPANTHRHWLGKWLSTSVSHNMHHQYFKHNYGLWTTIWDRLMNTLHPDYDVAFERVTQTQANELGLLIKCKNTIKDLDRPCATTLK
ncbi:MAG: sterol desaturase family protein [Undibacterium sp.]|nr:sterol desaturase family protein [Undibacterium sp.]